MKKARQLQVTMDVKLDERINLLRRPTNGHYDIIEIEMMTKMNDTILTMGKKMTARDLSVPTEKDKNGTFLKKEIKKTKESKNSIFLSQKVLEPFTGSEKKRQVSFLTHFNAFYTTVPSQRSRTSTQNSASTPPKSLPFFCVSAQTARAPA